MVDLAISTLALLTGLLTGAAFAALKVPIPAPPELPGVMGIIGIYVGYKLIQWAGWTYDLLGVLGIGG
jgi:XapX domain-containing protein